MKRLVRSALDPLPRALSLRSLAILVSMLVGGIALSVHEYLESGKVHAAPSSSRCAAESVEPAQRLERLECDASLDARFEIEPASAGRATTCDRPVATEPAVESSPGVWTPEAPTSGS